ncbi:MAG: glycosyltransferase family 39 protein [Anaerolineae bacterium]|nr:glycosyltransferase family 39 protein [Anaerolineae bacterium]
MPSLTRKPFSVLLAALLLIVIVLSRVPYFSQLELDAHEVWTMWQSVGTLPQVIDRTPYDWGPLYYTVMFGWQSAVGNHTETARVLSVLWLVLGSAFMYRAMARLRPGTAPLLATLLYATSAGIIYLSLNIRGYALQLALMPLAFWLLLRYFDVQRYKWHTVLTGILLAASMLAMVYIHPTGMLACVLLGAYTLFAYSRRILRWLLPGILVVAISIPQLIIRFGTATSRLDTAPSIFDLNSVYSFFLYYTGQSIVQQVLALLLLIIALFLLWRALPRFGKALPLLLAIIVGCGLLIFLGGRLGFTGQRHAWWLVTPVVLIMAWGLSYLPKPALIGCFALLLVGIYIPALPGSLDESGAPNPPLGVNFAWLAKNARWGDAVVIDPRQQCSIYPDEWDYYTRLYFPQGINVVTDPTGYRRVWYITADGWDNPTLKGQVHDNRLPSIFNGPWNCLFRLYVAPPDANGVLYDNGMRFHGYEILEDGQPLSIPLVSRESESVTVRLWWSADTHPTGDYSVGLYILDTANQSLVTQSDSGPQLIKIDPADFSPLPSATSQWKLNQLYVEERTLKLPDAIPVSRDGIHTYELALVVYQSADNTRANASGLTPDHLRVLQTFTVRSW